MEFPDRSISGSDVSLHCIKKLNTGSVLKRKRGLFETQFPLEKKKQKKPETWT